jgi:hypothetical protein
VTDLVKSPGESFRVEARGECTACGKQVDGWIAFDQESRIVDSGGFVVFAQGLTCDECLNAP